MNRFCGSGDAHDEAEGNGSGGQVSEAILEQDARSFDEIRQDFPILDQEINGRRLVYLDSAASSQMPRCVIDSYVHYHTTMHANVHRGVHTLSQRATHAYEHARERLATFLGLPRSQSKCCIFTRGATEAINLVAYTWGESHIEAGDVVLVSVMEHHANVVPWQRLCEKKGARVEVIPMNARGELRMEAYRELLTTHGKKVKLVAVNHVSNALGTINPVEEMIALAHAQGAVVMVDGCQAAPHMEVDVLGMDADFYAFSAHKMYGPTGIGLLYGKQEILETMPPFMSGGDMIDRVSFEQGTTFAGLPERFEAGTPSIAAGIGFGAAADYILKIGRARIAAHENALLECATERLLAISGSKVYGEAEKKASVLSFGLDGIHAQDIGTLLDSCGVAIRTGRHCAEPVMHDLGLQGTARASFAIYNGMDDVEAFIDALEFTLDMFA